MIKYALYCNPVRLWCSEAVVVACDEFFHFFKVFKVLKDAILKHSVELVLNRGQNRILLIDIEAQVLKLCVPVKLVQIKELKLVKDLTHASLHLCLIKERLIFKNAVLFW